MRLQKYILHSTVIGLFSGAFLFRIGFDFKIFYILILLNSFLILKSSGLFINKKSSLILIIITALGLFSIIAFKNAFSRVIFQIIGISVISNYFYNFFRYSKYSQQQIFKTYTDYAVIISVIGLFFFAAQLFLNINISFLLAKILPYGYPTLEADSNLKLSSIMLEPAHFAGIMLPSFVYCFYYFKSEKSRFFIIFIALILTFSAVGYAGLLFVLIVLFISIKSFLKKTLILLIAFSVSFLAYFHVKEIKMRIDDTISVILKNDYNFEGVNLSTYALISNYYVTSQVLKDSPIIGHGIGSHPISHDLYISGVNGGYIEAIGASNINNEDANSLLLRVLSEFGILGIAFIFYFIVKYYSNDEYQYSQAILVYFFYKLLREGHYFSPEMYFFVFLYINLHKDQMIKLFKTNKS